MGDHPDEGPGSERADPRAVALRRVRKFVATYTTKVSYTSSFRGVQEGLVAVYAYSQADGSIATAVIEKALPAA